MTTRVLGIAEGPLRLLVLGLGSAVLALAALSTGLLFRGRHARS